MITVHVARKYICDTCVTLVHNARGKRARPQDIAGPENGRDTGPGKIAQAKQLRMYLYAR